MHLSADPSNAPFGTPVTFTLTASVPNAPGALYYRVAYGDGSTTSNPVPQDCSTPPGPPASQTWTLTHQYAASGTYTVTATVGVNCTSNKATVSVIVSPTNPSG